MRRTDSWNPCSAGPRHSEALFQACSLRCSQSTRSRSRLSTASRLVSIACSETSSRCENRWKHCREVNWRTSRLRWSSTRHFSRANSKHRNTSPAACMISTSSRNTRNSGREPYGVFPMLSLRDSETWIPSHNSRRQPSSMNSWKRASHNRSSPVGRCRPPLPTSRRIGGPRHLASVARGIDALPGLTSQKPVSALVVDLLPLEVVARSIASCLPTIRSGTRRENGVNNF